MILIIPITREKETIIDIQDVELFDEPWYYTDPKGKGYAKRKDSRTGKAVFLHRIIIERKLGHPIPENHFVDHINGDSLDNRRDNLRMATLAQNRHNQGVSARNTSGYKGVSYARHIKGRKKWLATIRTKEKQFYLGVFLTPEEAARAYDEAAKKYQGEFARLNNVAE